MKKLLLACMFFIPLTYPVAARATLQQPSVGDTAPLAQNDEAITVTNDLIGYSIKATILQARAGDKLALNWLAAGIELQDPYAEYAAGWMYEHGVQLDHDPEQAQTFYILAATRDNPDAAYKLSQISRSVKQPTIAGKSSKEWLVVAAQKGSLAAMADMEKLIAAKDAAITYAMGNMYSNGLGKAKDQAKGLEFITQAANSGNVEALRELGAKHEYDYFSNDNPEDAKLAHMYYEKAAQKGLADAQYSLATLYDLGIGTAVNKTKAAYWYQKAADQNHADAQAYLGIMYANGRGVKRNYIKALALYRLADAQGIANATNNIGVLYRDGHGVPKNAREAFAWFRKAAEQNNSSGQLNLGRMYYAGNGVTRNLHQAAYWYKLAAEQNNPAAQYELATMYEKGLGGLDQNTVLANELYLKSVKGGYKPAKIIVKENRLTPATQ